ncbi:MAG: hypothetical protein CL946_11440 [Ectothiorhodospiraceae bacterium]|nr:hypothetical protein [Ectothiorhodospiraceae bacterium]
MYLAIAYIDYMTVRTAIPLLVLAIALAGCDIFETRDAEPPTVRGSSFVPPTTPSLALQNLQNAIAEKNLNDYLRCLVDTLSSDRHFEFIPTAGAAARYGSTFTDWNLRSEQTYFAAIVANTEDGDPSSLQLTGGFDITSSDSAIYNATYTLIFRHGVAGTPEEVTGTMLLTLATDRSNFWSIVRWTDLPDGTEPAWSDLKGRFAN